MAAAQGTAGYQSLSPADGCQSQGAGDERTDWAMPDFISVRGDTRRPESSLSEWAAAARRSLYRTYEIGSDFSLEFMRANDTMGPDRMIRGNRSRLGRTAFLAAEGSPPGGDPARPTIRRNSMTIRATVSHLVDKRFVERANTVLLLGIL